MKIRLSDNARAFLLAETNYLKARSTSAAKGFTAAFSKACRNLQAFDRIGFEPDDLSIIGMRRLVLGDYLLDYEVSRDEIWIVSIRNSRQLPLAGAQDQDFDYERG